MGKRTLFMGMSCALIGIGVASLILGNSVLFDDEDWEMVDGIELVDSDDETTGIIPNDPKVAKDLGYKK